MVYDLKLKTILVAVPFCVKPFEVGPVWPEKNRQMSIKVAQKWFHKKNDRFWNLYKNCLRMWEIWAKSLLPRALKSCPKCKKLPNLVTLGGSHLERELWIRKARFDWIMNCIYIPHIQCSFNPMSFEGRGPILQNKKKLLWQLQWSTLI